MVKIVKCIKGVTHFGVGVTLLGGVENGSTAGLNGLINIRECSINCVKK